MILSGSAVQVKSLGLWLSASWRPALFYRVCETVAEAGGRSTTIGGLSIPYAAIPMNKRIGITIGGTKYFMIFPFAGEARWRHQ
jgi:hypothetical protein